MLKHRTGHFNIRQGKRVKIFYKDGTIDIARYKGNTSQQVMFFDRDAIDKKQLRTLTIYKGEAGV